MKNIFTTSGKIGVLFACVAILAVTASAQITLRKAVDFDGDGKADFSVFRPGDNTWYIAKSGGGAIYQPFGSWTTDTQTPGDYDGDGKGDISVWRDTNGAWYRLNSLDSTFTAIQFGTFGDEPVARDYDGDGKTDIAVTRNNPAQGTKTWYVLRSTDGGLVGGVYGTDKDWVAPGDYDGDGKFDFAVQRPGANPTDPAVFFILQSTNNASVAIPWGFSSDFVVPGDYDGDGKTDIAVVREAATENAALSWYIRQSQTLTLKSAAFGATGSDLNVQNDYDGDGKTDIAVWRDSTVIFYVLRSTTNTVTGAQWGAPTDFPIASYDTN